MKHDKDNGRIHGEEVKLFSEFVVTEKRRNLSSSCLSSHIKGGELLS